jgi:hypothetical protein
MECTLEVIRSDCHGKYCISPGIRLSAIRGAADEAVLNKVQKRAIYCKAGKNRKKQIYKKVKLLGNLSSFSIFSILCCITQRLTHSDYEQFQMV